MKQMSTQTMDDYLSSQDLWRKVMAKDGSCLFRAVSEQLFLTQIYHLRVRQRCIEFMQENREQFESFVEGPFDHYLHTLRNPKEWAGQIEITALSQIYKHDFLIYQHIGKPAVNVTENSYTSQIVLCFSNGNHYDSVYSKDTKDSTTLCQSLIYELLYEKVFNVDDPLKLAAQTMTQHKHKHRRNNHHKNDSAEKSSESPAAADNKNDVESELCYQVAQSLDMSVYRNVELDVWTHSKKGQAHQDCFMSAGMQFSLGDPCEVVLNADSDKVYKGLIQKLVTKKGPVTVFIQELGERKTVPLSALRPDTCWSTHNTNQSYKALSGYYQKGARNQDSEFTVVSRKKYKKRKDTMPTVVPFGRGQGSRQRQSEGFNKESHSVGRQAMNKANSVPNGSADHHPVQHPVVLDDASILKTSSDQVLQAEVNEVGVDSVVLQSKQNKDKVCDKTNSSDEAIPQSGAVNLASQGTTEGTIQIAAVPQCAKDSDSYVGSPSPPAPQATSPPLQTPHMVPNHSTPPANGTTSPQAGTISGPLTAAVQPMTQHVPPMISPHHPAPPTMNNTVPQHHMVPSDDMYTKSPYLPPQSGPGNTSPNVVYGSYDASPPCGPNYIQSVPGGTGYVPSPPGGAGYAQSGLGGGNYVQQPAVTIPFYPYLIIPHVHNNQSPVNLNAAPSVDPSGADLPHNDPATLRWFYNLGCEYYHMQSMVQHQQSAYPYMNAPPVVYNNPPPNTTNMVQDCGAAAPDISPLGGMASDMAPITTTLAPEEEFPSQLGYYQSPGSASSGASGQVFYPPQSYGPPSYMPCGPQSGGGPTNSQQHQVVYNGMQNYTVTSPNLPTHNSQYNSYN